MGKEAVHIFGLISSLMFVQSRGLEPFCESNGTFSNVGDEWRPNISSICRCTAPSSINCSVACIDYQQNLRKPGDQWLEDPTTNCTCTDQNSVKCEVLKEPVCMDISGNLRKNKETWMNSSCVDCTCINGGINCTRKDVNISYGLYSVKLFPTCEKCDVPSRALQRFRACKVYRELSEKGKLFKCASGGFYIRDIHQCNGIGECPDESDEDGCDDVVCKDEEGSLYLIKDDNGWQVSQCTNCHCKEGLLTCRRNLSINFPAYYEGIYYHDEDCIQPQCNVAKFVREKSDHCEAIERGRYLPLPPKLANKKAVINVQNRDNECLKWALRAALFPPRDGKNPQRTSRYPVDDGINHNGIDFPTPLKQIDRLEAQNRGLAINVFGWEDDCVIPLRTSKKENSISRINLMLIESGLIQHYCFVKRVSALLYDQTKSHNKKHFCMMCLTGFTRADLLEKHEKYCNGVNGRPTRIEMPEEGKNTLSFKNYQKQMKAPFVIYADFEALLRKMQGCKRETPEDSQKRKEQGEELEDLKKKSYTEKTEQHEACGFAYTVVRSDGKHEKPYVYRGENAVEVFLNCLLSEEKKIRFELSKQKPLVMTSEDWEKFKNATDCHICEKTLMKQNFLDSLPVWIGYYGELNYFGQLHKKCYYSTKKAEQSLGTEHHYELKKLTQNTHIVAAKNQKKCLKCHKPLIQPNYKDVVKDHCHITGKFRGAAHNICNLMMRINPKNVQIPVVFHNLRGYDAHHLMQAMSKISKEAQKEVKCVANNMEKYITFSFGGLRFIDSLNFLQGSLDSLVTATPKESLNITKSISTQSDESFELLCKKGIYPYEYMDSWERFSETSLPEKEKFYSKLNDENITDEEYKHAQNVWETFGCQTLGDYHDLYVKTDVSLLADVFENFRKICLEKYGLDPANYYTTPGLSWDALLKKTGVELELLTDYEMHLFVERGLRGGISMVSKRYAKANNPYVEGFDPSQPKKYIMYLDANNLYGWAMSKPLPKSGFRWKMVMPTEKEIMTKKEFAKAGWILEVDLEYPKELHDAQNSYPLAPEKKKINKEMFSPYQKKIIKNLDLKLPESEKLVLTLEDKSNYVVHYRNLQFYLKQGMKLKKVHRVLEFEQECWMEPYIRMNTEFRKKAKNDFEKNFYKLMNNSVFGKTMENLRNRVDIRIARSDETKKIRKLVASPLYSRHVMFSNDLVGIDMRKSRLFLNKPVYTGMTILDVSKLCMYDFFYNHLKKEYGERCELLYTDTDSLLLEIETEDVYADMAKNIDKYDTSDYPKEHSLHSNENKKVLGKMKDECAGKQISECVCLRPKMYSIMTEDKKNIKKAKGVKECVTKKKINHENFKETLFQTKESFHEMHMIRSYAHELYSIVVNKKSLSSFDSKRWIADDGIHTNAYGYKFCETKPT
ncbi:hypothetical protein ACROYT_G004435 [Oculina patagonica]